MIYGEVGAGKTALALTLGARAMCIDMDEGLRTGITLQDSFTSDRKAVEVRQFLETNPQKDATAFAKCKSFVYGLTAEFQKGRPFEALILDSLSSFAEGALRYIMSNSGQLGKAPEIQHWGLAFNEIQNVLAVMRSLPIPLVIIAHEQVKMIGKAGPNQESKLEIAISGKNLPSRICRYCDEVLYMRARPVGAGKMQYVVQTVGDDKLMARSRSNIPNLTDTKVGMWELMRMMGYVPPEKGK